MWETQSGGKTDGKGDGEGATVPDLHGGGIRRNDRGRRTEVRLEELVIGTNEAALSMPSPRAATPGSLLVEGATPLGKGGSGGPAFHRRESPVSDSQLPDTLRWRGLADLRI